MRHAHGISGRLSTLLWVDSNYLRRPARAVDLVYIGSIGQEQLDDIRKAVP